MDLITLFVDVILPVPIPGTFTYRVPFDLAEEVAIGKRVVVSFGKKKYYSGIINAISDKSPAAYEAKYIESVLDEVPIINTFQLKLWSWMSSYYMCTMGDLMQAALPNALKMESETTFILNPNTNFEVTDLSDREFLIFEALEIRKELNINDISSILGLKSVHAILKKMIDKQLIVALESFIKNFTSRKIKLVELNQNFHFEEKLKELFDNLNRAPKQLELLMGYIELSNWFGKRTPQITVKQLKERLGDKIPVKELVKKEIFNLIEVEEGYNLYDSVSPMQMELSEIQQKAFTQINEGFTESKPVLLHGITSSGKTEIYVKLIEECLAKNEQVLYLLPEIALTTQIIKRLSVYFGDKIGVFHSRYSQHDKTTLWKEIRDNKKIKIVLGARSAVFLPFSKLGLVIVDEEHENTFKQFDPAPRYHARDTSLVLAKLHQAKVLLGTATPSVESYQNYRNGKYKLVEITQRYQGVQLPEILISDVKEAQRKKQMTGSLSKFMVDNMKETLVNNEQIILFINRRGFSPYIQCNVCAWIPHCINCDVSLTYHKHIDLLKCHYCGHSSRPPKKCGACSSPEIDTKGFGTEKIELELAELFPKYKTARLDLDATRKKNSFQTIISDFENNKIQILIGTQMVTKGLDFDNVGLVGILNADNMLNFPDFRAYERSYQLMTQVAGRAGRKSKRGKVIIQTYAPTHSIILDVIKGDYTNMFMNEVLDRQNFKFPPFYKLIRITLKHRDKEVIKDASNQLAMDLRTVFANRVIGPEYPLVSRLRNLYQKCVIIKLEVKISVPDAKLKIRKCLDNLKHNSNYRSVRQVVDVDAY